MLQPEKPENKKVRNMKKNVSRSRKDWVTCPSLRPTHVKLNLKLKINYVTHHITA